MPVEFAKSNYLKLNLQNGPYKTQEDLLSFVDAHPQFQYGSVKYDQFAQSHSLEGRHYRQACALPLALWTGIVLTTYHVAMAIIVGTPKALAGDDRTLLAHYFSVSRNAQEALGYLAILAFQDTYGTYLVQDSHFHKTCYESFLTNDKETNEVTEEIPRVASNTTAPAAPASQASNEIDQLKQEIKEKRTEILKVSGEIHLLEQKNREIRLAEEQLYAKLAEAHYQKGDLDKSFKTINCIIYRDTLKNSLLLKLAEAYIRNNDPENAEKVLFKVEGRKNQAEKDTLWIKCGEIYLKQGKLANARQSHCFTSNEYRSEPFMAKLAQKFYDENNLDDACEVIKFVHKDSKTRNALLTKIAQSYFDNDHIKNAVYAATNIQNDIPLQESLLVQYVNTHAKQNKEQRILEILSSHIQRLLSIDLNKMSIYSYNKGEVFCKSKASTLLKEHTIQDGIAQTLFDAINAKKQEWITEFEENHKPVKAA